MIDKENAICMIIELYAAMAQAEIEKKEKHQREGIDAKKNRGEWDDYGCPAIMSQKEFLEHYEKVLSGELRPFELMKQLGINWLKKNNKNYYCFDEKSFKIIYNPY